MNTFALANIKRGKDSSQTMLHVSALGLALKTKGFKVTENK